MKEKLRVMSPKDEARMERSSEKVYQRLLKRAAQMDLKRAALEKESLRLRSLFLVEHNLIEFV